MRIEADELAPQRGPGEALDLDLAARGGERMARCRPDDFRVIGVGDDHAAAVGPEVGAVEAGAVELGRQAPVEAIAKIEVIGPLAVAQQVAARGLDFDDYHLALGVDAHQVGTAPVPERHLGQRPDVVAREQPADPARDGHGATLGRIREGGESGRFGHARSLEQIRNVVKRGTAAPPRPFPGRRGRGEMTMPAALQDRCYWTETARSAPAHPSLSGDLAVDVAIVGGGVVGVTAARLLKDRGLAVAVVEAGRIGHGVTGRSTAKVTAQHSLFLQRIEGQHGAEAARAYAEANRAGVALIGELAARHGLACDLEPADSYVYATSADGIEQLEAERAAAERAGLAMEIVGDAGLPYPVSAALRLGGQAQFQPVDFVAGLAATLPGEGSFVFENSRATDWSETRIATDAGTIEARRVIMATHLPLGQVGLFYAHTHPHMHAIMAVPVAGERAPAGMHISADRPKRSIRRHRGANGETVLILTGPTFKHGKPDEEEQAFGELAAFARDHFDHRGGGWRWSNEDYAPRDGLPYVGWSGAEGGSLLVATGFDAWGLSNGAAAAQLLADLCEGRENARVGLFDASRHSLKGLGKFARDQAEVASDLIGGHLRSHPDAADAAPLAEGDIVKVEGSKAGIYRDGAGELRAVSVACTHMGCALGWNTVDRTWDCPCHGSRFAADGAVLHGPAVKPLAPVELAAGGES